MCLSFPRINQGHRHYHKINFKTASPNLINLTRIRMALASTTTTALMVLTQTISRLTKAVSILTAINLIINFQIQIYFNHKINFQTHLTISFLALAQTRSRQSHRLTSSTTSCPLTSIELKAPFMKRTRICNTNK